MDENKSLQEWYEESLDYFEAKGDSIGALKIINKLTNQILEVIEKGEKA